MARISKTPTQTWRQLFWQSGALYLMSRLLYLGFGLLLSAFILGTPDIGGSLSFNQPWHALLFRLVYTADSAFYHSIAMHGYSHVHFNTEKQYNWAFFPLYPYLTRWTRDLIHLRVVDAGFVWTQLSMIAFLLLLGRTVDRRYGRRMGFFAMTLAAFSPLTPYFTAYRAGALFLALSMAVFYFLDQESWGWAVVFGALASLARPVGILLAVPYLIAVIQSTPTWARRIPRGLAAAGFGFGFVVVGFIDWRYTQNPLAFLAIQKAWNRKTAFPFAATVHWFLHPTLTAQGGWAFPLLAIVASLLTIAVGIWWLRHDSRQWPGVGYMLITVLLANASNSFEGIPRFVAELPPLYVALAVWTDQRPLRKWLMPVLLGACFLGYAALWALGIHAVQN